MENTPDISPIDPVIDVKQHKPVAPIPNFENLLTSLVASKHQLMDKHSEEYTTQDSRKKALAPVHYRFNPLFQSLHHAKSSPKGSPVNIAVEKK